MLMEYLRPWKLATFAIGLGLLLIGADYEAAPDWDYPISFVMATMAYLTAPWSVQVIRDRRWRWIPLALLWYYLTVDGSYWLYWQCVKPGALIMRDANFHASTCLYWLCGFIWLHRGPLRTALSASSNDRPRSRRPISILQIAGRLTTTLVMFLIAYYTYSSVTGETRMRKVCQQLRPGMSATELDDFAERHGLGPRGIRAQTGVRYLAESRSVGRHACRVEVEDGRVMTATYNFAD